VGSTESFAGTALTIRNPCIRDPLHDPLLGDDWRADAEFRDFTCNGAYFDIHHGILIDPLACALSDLTARKLKSAMPNVHEDAFNGLRVIRAGRFAYRGFQLDDAEINILQPIAERPAPRLDATGPVADNPGYRS
jgi:hypothetical protein